MKKIFFSIVLFFIISSVVIAAYKHETVASMLIEYSDFVEIGPNVFVSIDTSYEQKQQLLELLHNAKERVEKKFGEVTSLPIVIASYNMEKLSNYVSNTYGATHFTLTNAYIVLGTNGQNIDVVSHELVHAELFHRIGYFDRWFKIPLWFDEGMAMQVDLRERYNEPQINMDISELKYCWQFFRGNDEELRQHYSLAKHEIREWIKNKSDSSFYKLLNDINKGVSFHDAYYGSKSS